MRLVVSRLIIFNILLVHKVIGLTMEHKLLCDIFL